MHTGLLLLLWLLPLQVDALPAPAAEKLEIVALQDLTDGLRTRLEITERVHVTLVDHNPLVMSVETLAGRTGPFIITVDRDFIGQLNHDEIEAALAHELGHVLLDSGSHVVPDDTYLMHPSIGAGKTKLTPDHIKTIRSSPYVT